MFSSPHKRKIGAFLFLLVLGVLLGPGRAIAGDGAAPTSATTTIALAGDVRLTTYIIAPGDRFSLLEKRLGLPRAAIARSNPAVRLSDLNVGDVIVLPLPRPAALSPNETCKEIVRGLRGFGRLALTFDAGGDVGDLYNLLGTLEDRKVHGSFFVTGRWVEHNPAALKRIADGGHEVYGHTFTHRALSGLSSTEILNEIEKTDRIIYQTVGRGTRPYFRPPFGEGDRRVLQTAGSAGWQSVYWTLDCRDAVGSPKTPKQIVSRVLSPPGIEDRRRFLDGAIVLFHANQTPTAAAIGPIIDGLRRLDVEPVSLTTLLHPPKPTSNSSDSTGRPAFRPKKPR
jgi:peptidoglycan/xylan/chitin deacetylase (PgdA/CDA1 family)